MKKTLQHLITALCLTMLLTYAPFAYAATPSFEIKATTVTGGAVAADVTMDGSVTASGLQFSIGYDPNVLHLDNSENGSLGGSYTVNASEPGLVRVVWYSVNGSPISNSEPVLKLSFTPVADGTANIWFDNATPFMLVDHSLNTVDADTKDASITITGSPTTIFTAAPVTAAPAVTDVPYQLATPAPTAIASATPQPLLDTAAASTPAATAAPVQTNTDDPPAGTITLASPPAAIDPAPASSAPAPVTQAPTSNNPVAENAPPQIEVLNGAAAKKGFPWYIPVGCSVALGAVLVYLYKRKQK